MAERPSTRWRRQVDEQTAEVAGGVLTEDKAYAAQLWPPTFIDAVDQALAAYEREVAQFAAAADDEQVWAAVERVVTALNELDVEEGRIETEEREDLAEYIDAVLTGAGVDVEGLTARRDLDRSELTDEWREW
ncbi:hypothetical protein [Actinoplanes sp. DH11]|uniref:hypothetical protein n=1 Tax=Actinoplanes sp. DH11 TaxID=2857011 RepID=UPI001E48B8E6|nr:hypothetical protein [Actinoplanes sp. DH11]